MSSNSSQEATVCSVASLGAVTAAVVGVTSTMKRRLQENIINDVYVPGLGDSGRRRELYKMLDDILAVLREDTNPPHF